MSWVNRLIGSTGLESNQIGPGACLLKLQTVPGAVVFSIVFSLCSSNALAFQVPDNSFREFTRASVPSPAELFQSIATLQGDPEWANAIGAAESARLDELAVLAKELYSRMTPEQRQKAKEYFERSFDNDGNASPAAKAMLEKAGISSELQQGLVNRFKTQTGKRQPSNRGESPTGSSAEARPDHRAVNPTSRRRPGGTSVSPESAKPDRRSRRNESSRLEHNEPTENRRQSSSNRRSNGRNNTTPVPTNGAPFDPSNPATQDMDWAKKLGAMVKSGSQPGRQNNAASQPPASKANQSSDTKGFPLVTDKFRKMFSKSPDTSAKAKEKYEARFDRLLMESVNRSLTVKSESSPDSAVSRSVNLVLDQLIESVHESVNETIHEKRRAASRPTPSRPRTGGSSNRPSDSGSFSPVASLREAFTGEKKSSNSRQISGETTSEAQFDFRFWIFSAALFLLAGVGVFWFRGMGSKRAGKHFQESKRHRRLARKKIRSQRQLVNAVDDFLVGKFGPESQWWNARIAQEVLCAGAPQFNSRISKLFLRYTRARYCRQDMRLSEEVQQDVRSLLIELSKLTFSDSHFPAIRGNDLPNKNVEDAVAPATEESMMNLASSTI